MPIDIYDKGFQNWLKGVLGLNETRTALCKCMSAEFEDYVKDIPPSELTQFFCCLKSNRIARLNPHIKGVTHWECQHDQCKDLMDRFINNYKQEDVRKLKYEWKLKSSGSIDDSCPRNEGKSSTWNVIALYMHMDRNEPVEKYSSLESLDISHVIKVMRNCKLFSTKESDEPYDEVLNSRNTLMHSPNNTLNEDETKIILKWLCQLLNCLNISKETYYKKAKEYLHNLGEKDFVMNYQSDEYRKVLSEVLEAKGIADNLYQYIGDENQHCKRQSKQLQEMLERIGGVGSATKGLEMQPTVYKSLVKGTLEKKKETIVLDKAKCDENSDEYKKIEKLEEKIDQEIQEVQEIMQKPEPEEMIDYLNREVETLKEEKQQAKAEVIGLKIKTGEQAEKIENLTRNVEAIVNEKRRIEKEAEKFKREIENLRENTDVKRNERDNKEGKSHHVSPYSECKGGAKLNTEINILKVHDPVFIPMQSNYLTFLKRKCCAELDYNLKKNYCSLEFTDRGLTLHCTITPKITGFKDIAKQWEETSISIVDKYISKKIVKRVLKSTEQVWTELIEFVNSEKNNTNKEVVTVVESVTFEILLIGFKDPVNDTWWRLHDKQADIEKQTDIDKQADIENQADIDKQADNEKQPDIEKQTDIDKQTEFVNQADIDKQADIEKQVDIEKQADIEKQVDIEKQADVEKHQRRITETIRDYDNLNLNLLNTIGVFDNFKHTLQDIEIDIGDREIIIEGQPEDITKVRLKLFDLENQIYHKQWNHQFSRDCVFFVNNVLTNKICSLLQRNNITAAWKMDENVFEVYAYDDEVNNYEAIGEDCISSEVGIKSEQLLKSAVVEMKEPFQDSIFEVLTSPEWISFTENITETYENAAELEVKDDGEILVHGMKKEAEEVHNRMKDFLDKNAIISDIFTTERMNIRFLQTHRKDFVERLERKLEQHKVKIELKDDSIKIKGNKAGISEAKKEFKIFVGAILCDKHTVQNVDVKNIFKDRKEQEIFEEIERETSCLIKISGSGKNAAFGEPGNIIDKSEDRGDEKDDWYGIPRFRKDETDSSQGIQIGKIKLSVFINNILSQKTDAIVSTVGRDFQFVGAVANEIKSVCPKIEEECRKQENVYKLNENGVVITDGYTLQAKHVIFVKFAESIEDWEQRIYTCLETANKSHLRSIAFPVLGTGKGFKRFSAGAITCCLFDAVNDFILKNGNPSIREILLIIYHGQEAMYKPIMTILHKKVQEADKTGSGGTEKAAVKKIRASDSEREEGTISGQNMQKLQRETSSLDLLIYSDRKDNIEICMKLLELNLEDHIMKIKIVDFKEIIKTLQPHELEQLDITALANINIDENTGIITIEGPSEHVSNVVHNLQMTLLKIKRQRNEVSSAEELYKLVQWQYGEVTEKGFEYTAYEKDLNQKIENAYKTNKSKFEFEDNDGETFVIDFNKLEEYKKSDDQDRLRVVRKDILKAVATALPEEWADMKDNENIKVVSVPSTDKEYQDIEARFIQEVKTGSYSHRLNFNANNLKVNKIERIQNRTLYQQYQAKKNQMKELKPNLQATLPYERDLWHGTKYDAVTSIQMHGFNRSYSGNANGEPWYGEGVYFAGNASYSARGWLSGAGVGAGSKGYMFVVKTLTGQLCKGQKGMRYLPLVDPKDPTILYDCAVDNLQNPLEFVIFNDTQAYPAYIITFTT